MLAAGSDGGHMLASGSDDGIVKEPPPQHLLHKPCCESVMPWRKEHHKWSWTKAQNGARVEFKKRSGVKNG